MNPLKILHVFRAPVGGLFRHVLDLAREQIARGHHVGLIADSNTGGSRAEETLGQLAPSLALGLTRTPMRRHIGPSDAFALSHVMRRIAQSDADIIHGHGAKGGAYARMSFSARHSVRAYTPHGGSLLFGHNTLAGKFYLVSEKFLMLRGDLFLFESAYSAEVFRRVAREIRGCAPALILVTDRASEGLPVSTIRSRFVTTLAAPFDAAGLADALRIARGNMAERPEEARHKPITPSAQSLSILVAEDKRTNQIVIAKILDRAGHRVTIVDNGEAALDILEMQEFDLVLMDVNMPVMNGIEATKLYRFAALGKPHTPIVALTADATEDVAKRCEEAGMDACITKPIEPNRLLEIIARLVQDTGKTPKPVAATAEVANYTQGRPRLRAATPSAVDMNTLEALEHLGGKEFVDELAGQFIDDAVETLDELAVAATSGNLMAFREQLHALRSAAANVGARGIYEMCLGWRHMSPEEFASQGEAHLKKLHEEFERVRLVLRGRIGNRNAAA